MMGRRRASNDPSVRTRLTERQEQVLALVAAGATNAEIAERLGLSLDGVKWHLREIFVKFGVDSREEAVARWKGQRRRIGPFAWAPFWIPVGAGGTLAAAVLGVAILTATLRGGGGSHPTTRLRPTVAPDAAQITPAALEPQPALREVAAGDSWRLLLADDGRPMPALNEAILVIASGQSPPRVDVLGADGRIAARIETGYQPMARLNLTNGTVVVSDETGPGEGPLKPRALVFALSAPRLLAEISLPKERVNFTIFGNAIAVSPDGRWMYWVEHTVQPDPPSCASGGDEAVCDMMVIHAVNLVTATAADFAAPMPRACGVPAFTPYQGAAIVAQCAARQGSRWVIDAGAPPGNFALSAPTGAPEARWDWSYGRAGDLTLEVSISSDGSLTSAALRDIASGSTRAEMPLTDTWGAFLLDDQHTLFLRSNGRLEEVNLLTSIGVQLLYAIDPGRQGLDVILTR